MHPNKDERAEIAAAMASRAGAKVESGDVEGRLSAMADQLADLQAVLRLLLMSAGEMPITQIGTPKPGADIGTTNAYRELWTNNLGRLVSLRVTLEPTIPGQKVSLSTTPDLSNTSRISLLSSGGPVISTVIWLKPEQTLWWNTADTAFNLTGAWVRIYIFDPLAFRRDLGGGI